MGFSLSDALGGPVSRYLRDIEWSSVLNLDEAEWSRLVTREIETNYPEHRFLAFYLVPLELVKAEEKGAVLILRDITHERENEEKVIESERMQAIMLLAAGVAHEIGNPLNSLGIHLQLLERELGNLRAKKKEELVDLVKVARQEVARLDMVINQFLQAIRPSGRLDCQKVALESLLQQTLEFMQREIEDRGVWVNVRADKDLPLAWADPTQIKQVFFNVIRNAMQAMPEGGLLGVRLASSDRFIKISFQDTGKGIAAKDFGRIFEPYHTTKDEGTGLGLMIVRRIMRDHGGEIEIDTREEQGLTITLSIPREDQRVRLLKAHRNGNGGGVEGTEGHHEE